MSLITCMFLQNESYHWIVSKLYPDDTALRVNNYESL